MQKEKQTTKIHQKITFFFYKLPLVGCRDETEQHPLSEGLLVGLRLLREKEGEQTSQLSQSITQSKGISKNARWDFWTFWVSPYIKPNRQIDPLCIQTLIRSAKAKSCHF